MSIAALALAAIADGLVVLVVAWLRELERRVDRLERACLHRENNAPA
jgi:hypothetical protein